MSFVKYKEVYAAAAEVLGLILQHVTERKQVSAAKYTCDCHYPVSAYVTSALLVVGCCVGLRYGWEKDLLSGIHEALPAPTAQMQADSGEFSLLYSGWLSRQPLPPGCPLGSLLFSLPGCFFSSFSLFWWSLLLQLWAPCLAYWLWKQSLSVPNLYLHSISSPDGKNRVEAGL